MHTEGSYLAGQLTRLLRMMRRELVDIPDESLNTELSVQPSNTLYQLGTHVAGSARFWSISNTGGPDFHRDRNAEFIAAGSKIDLLADLDSLIDQINTHVTTLTSAQLDEPLTLAGASFSFWDDPNTLPQRHAVLHALEHTGLHLGHVQITRQILGFAPPSVEE